MGKVMAVCISAQRGTKKENVQQVEFIQNYGLKHDGHAGEWHRQVSLLSYDRVEEFRAKGIHIEDGDFGENLLVKGIDFKTLPIGTILRCNDVVLELTQVGKQCHNRCRIYDEIGDCIMPREGVFAKVLKGGIITVGDDLYVEGIQ